MMILPDNSGRRRAPAATAQDSPVPAGEAQVRRSQLEALAHFAPDLAIASTTGALLVAWMLRSMVNPLLVGTWLILIVAAHWLTVAMSRAATFRHAGGVVPRGVLGGLAIANGLCGGLWAWLPAVSLDAASGDIRIALCGAAVAVAGAGLVLAASPLSALARTGALAAVFALFVRQPPGLPVLGLLAFALVAYTLAAVRIGGLNARSVRAASEQHRRGRTIADQRGEADDQGAGWGWRTDPQNRLVQLSPSIAQLLGRNAADAIGQTLPVALGSRGTLGQALAGREQFGPLEIDVETPGGSRRLAVAGEPLRQMDGSFCGFRGNVADVTEVRLSERRLRELANSDMLTGLPNRMRMRELIAEAIDGARQAGSRCALLLCDLDGFKPVNDMLGHPVGDALLQQVAARLEQQVGAAGTVGRIGGDEFAVLLPDGGDPALTAALARRLIAEIGEPYTVSDQQVRIGISIGSAIAPQDGEDLNGLVKRADLALYRAKALGRGRWCPFEPRMQQEADDRRSLERDLRKAVALGQFNLLYQPLVHAGDGSITAFEALLRWHHPERGVVPPAEFVPIAEEIGLIAEIGEWVIRTATREAAAWPPHIGIAVNLSPIQLTQPSLPTMVAEALALSRLAPGRLELEVTEGVFLQEADGSLDTLRRLRALGIRIALDDFGTGYSSLGYLNKTIFHALKIDGSFVRAAVHEPETVSIIQAIVTLANIFQMTIVAEGIEREEERELMRRLGCHRLQGFLFGMPLDLAAATTLVGTRHGSKAANG